MFLNDFIIAFVITMLIMTLITERVSDFIKVNLRNVYTRKAFFANNIVFHPKALALKQTHTILEKQRISNIMLVNIIIGIITATLINANLFQIVRTLFQYSSTTDSYDDKTFIPVIGWFKPIDSEYHLYIISGILLLLILSYLSLFLFKEIEFYNRKYLTQLKNIFGFIVVIFIIVLGIISFIEEDYFFILSHIFGYIGTGIFLSLGSKFWHDLLDLLIHVKNAKRRLNETNTFTQYQSAEQITNLINTPVSEVVSKLFEKYRDDISDISGVASYGINKVLDKRTGQFKQLIEVEFTHDDAQEKLESLSISAELMLNGNTFLLKDYIHLLYTRPIRTLTEEAIALSSREKKIIEKAPICYAYNKEKNKKRKFNYGSFGVEKIGNEFFAISNLHVFASERDLKEISKNSNYNIVHKSIQLVINDEFIEEEVEIREEDIRFNNIDGYGYDYCSCKVSKEVYNKYYNLLDKTQLQPSRNNDMSMYGAYSKYAVDFFSFYTGTHTTIDFGEFEKEMYLFKLTPTNQNVMGGDSGSIIYYKIDDSDRIYRGMLVAKSDNYAYMFRLNFLSFI